MADSNNGSKKKELLKWLSLIVGALLAFFFGLVSSLADDTVKGADACYDVLTQYLENVSSDFWELNHARRIPLPEQPDPQNPQEQRVREAARKYNTEIDATYLKVQSKCPLTVPHTYLKSEDVAKFNDDYNELAKKCFEAPECSDVQADTVQRKSADSTKPLIDQAGTVATWGWLQRGIYALRHSW